MTQTTAAGARADEWLTPDGINCPVPEHVVVDIVRRDGSEDHLPAGFCVGMTPCQNSWVHNGGDCDVIRYRVAGARRWDVAYHSAALAGDSEGMSAALAKTGGAK